MAQTFDICIRGTGVVGTTLALLLARDRLKVALLPAPGPKNPAATDVRAYALNLASRQLLESLRSWPDEEHATAVRQMQVQGDQGGAVRFDAAAQGVQALAWIVDVPALESRLAEAVRYQPHVEVVNAPVPAALTVVCEGRASSTRDEFGVNFDVTPYAQHAIATRLRCERPHGQVARQWFLPDGILAFLPLGGREGNSVAVVWSVLQEQVAPLLALSPQEFAQRLQTASQEALGALELTAERAAWPLQLARADRWCGPVPGTAAGRPARSWALAGDAAHNVHPLAGQGLNLGLADAQALAAVLHGRDYWRSVADLRLLRRYERERKAALVPMGLATDGLQQLFARQEGPIQALRNWGMKGFERSGPLKDFVARQAMGI
ncbi:ubiquinone biosynthesis protein UbiH [Acidovorax sp. Leaf76]|uniref:FAD-dependent monooxygenase n=1 Tax=unclassified Acidovorax TaxID=2684926 RepID=UPI0006F230BB|nr:MULTISPECIES: FAD-dependent monooxygenase [unclassified Acidovorax]KQO16535.1 ubiquinone biosynthesis protein UbiH [Acidovorax sp. Leaf76]KQO32598.1 ubiquinone biosynthesis protein UbiH [Acidovorax sp. Leaf84]KQS32169.1 ubiquinone biosynthesis protein UbiH [Acidovorax sp. Leaf191]